MHLSSGYVDGETVDRVSCLLLMLYESRLIGITY